MNNNENLEEMINFIQSFANKSDEEILLEGGILFFRNIWLSILRPFHRALFYFQK